MGKKKILNCIVGLTFALLLTACGTKKNATTEESSKTTEAYPKTTEECTETKEEIVLEKYKYEIDYHRLSPFYEQIYTPEEIDAANKVIDAFLNEEATVEVAAMTRADIEATESLLRIMCPTFMAMVKVDLPLNYDEYTTAISWTYRRPLEEVREEIQKFEAEVAHYLDELYENDSQEMRAMIIYLMLSEETSYDYTLAEDEFGGMPEEEVAYKNTAYWVLVGHTGVCYSYAEALVFLYNQAGMEAYDVSNFDGAHEWTLVKIDEKFYYVDATWSGSFYGYYDLSYFGLTTEDREGWAGGFSREANVIEFHPVSEFCEVDDTKYDYLHNKKYVSVSIVNIDHENQTMEIQLDNGDKEFILGKNACVDLEVEVYTDSQGTSGS